MPRQGVGAVLAERIRAFIVSRRADSRLPSIGTQKSLLRQNAAGIYYGAVAFVPPFGDRVETAWPSSNLHTIIVAVRSKSSSIWLPAITGRSNGPARTRSVSS